MSKISFLQSVFLYKFFTVVLFSSIANASIQEEIADEVSITVEALKVETKAEETPQSINTISAKDIEEKAVKKIDEAFRYSPSVVTPYGSDNDAEWLFVRGFEPSMYLDGNRLYKEGFFAFTAETYGLESIELLKGPSSILYGETNPGGIINLVQKKPTYLPQASVIASAGNKNYAELGVDVSNWVNKDGSQRYRIVAMINQKDGELEGTESKRIYIAPSYTIDFSDNTSLTMLASYLKDDGVPQNGFFPKDGTLTALPNGEIIDYSTNYGFPSDKFTKEQVTAGYQFNHSFNDIFTYNQNFNFTFVDLYLRSSSAYPNPGDGSWNTDDDPYTINRYSLINDGYTSSYTFDNNIVANWVSGSFKNRVLTGVDYQYHTNDWIGNGNGALVGTINSLNPTYDNVPDLTDTLYDNEIVKNQVGFYAQGQTIFKEKLLFNLGTRYDLIDIENTGSTKDSLQDENLSLSTGLMYLGKNGVSPYVSYSESFYVISSMDWVTAKLYKPVESNQVEAGVKYTPTWYNGFINIAYFNIEQQNAMASTISEDGVLSTSQTGKVLSRGVELETKAKITKDLEISASYTYANSREETQEDGMPTGRYIRKSLSPNHYASAWAVYDFSSIVINGLKVGTGVRYTGETIDNSTINLENVTKVPSYLLIDMMASYRINEAWGLQVNLNNLTNQIDVVGCDYGICYYGESRRMSANLKYDF